MRSCLCPYPAPPLTLISQRTHETLAWKVPHSSQSFLPPWAEKQDVHAFLLENLTNGGILELMMRYLKGMGHKFLLRWPPGLAEVVLSIYHSWRRHSTSLPNPLLRDCSNKHIKVRWAGGLLRAGIILGPGDGHRDLLWVQGCCHVEPTQQHPFVGLGPGPLESHGIWFVSREILGG